MTPRRLALLSFLVALAICAVSLTRRFHPVSLVLFAPAFLLPVFPAAFFCSPKRKKGAAVGGLVGSVVGSAALAIGAIILSTDDHLAHGMYGFYDFLALAILAALAAAVAVAVGFALGSFLGKTEPNKPPEATPVQCPPSNQSPVPGAPQP